MPGIRHPGWDDLKAALSWGISWSTYTWPSHAAWTSLSPRGESHRANIPRARVTSNRLKQHGPFGCILGISEWLIEAVTCPPRFMGDQQRPFSLHGRSLKEFLHPFSSNTLDTWCEELILEKTLMLGKIEGKRRRGDREWDGRMALSTQWAWVWANSGRWWRTGKAGVLQSMGSQRVRHDWETEEQQQKNFHKDCPGGPVVMTPCFLYRGCRLDLWLGNSDSPGCVAKKKTKKTPTELKTLL